MSNITLAMDGVEGAVRSALMATGADAATATRYAHYVGAMHEEIFRSPELREALESARTLYEGGSKVATGTAHLRRATELGHLAAVARYGTYAYSGAAGVLSVFHDRFSALAKQQGIPLNECAMAISKVALTAAAAGAAAVPTGGLSLIVLAFALLEQAKQGMAVYDACKPTAPAAGALQVRRH